MNRSFTMREKILLLFLAVMLLGVGYFKLFYEPMQEQITASEQRMTQAQDQFAVETVRLQRMRKMQEEIEQFKQSGATAYSEIPPYDNVQNVMIQLNTILSQATDYSVSFQSVQKQDGSKLVTRPIDLTFTASDYATVRTIMNELYHCRFRCAIEQVSVSAKENLSVNNDINVSLSITFYEKQVKSQNTTEDAADAS